MYKLKTPITHEGETYTHGFISLSSSDVARNDGTDYSTAVNLSVIPARIDGDGKIVKVPQLAISGVLKSDISGQGTPAEIEAFAAISGIIVGHLKAIGILEA